MTVLIDDKKYYGDESSSISSYTSFDTYNIPMGNLHESSFPYRCYITFHVYIQPCGSIITEGDWKLRFLVKMKVHAVG